MTRRLSFDVQLTTPYERAIDQVTAALKAEGFGVLTRIEVDKTLKEKIGVAFRPYTILGACNPPLAHRALTHRPELGIVLPCNVTVEAADGGTLVRIGDPEAMMLAGDLSADPALREIATEARTRLSRVADALRAG